MSLLPKSHSQFHEKSFWDNFFHERGQEAFEWYGEFQDLAGNLFRKIKREDRILVVGCGNSNLSSSLYDLGFKNITNLDFSDSVIREMTAKNESREQMKWLVGDMTNMSSIDSHTFDVVLDKGALDALVSDNTAAQAEQATAMFQEISRVLAPGGRYACISLAESFIIRSYMNYFCCENVDIQQGWSVSIEVVLCQKPSPFLPFFVVATKKVESGVVEAAPTVNVFVDNIGNKLQSPCQLSPNKLFELLETVQQYNQKRYDLGEIQVGRYETVDFWAPDGIIQTPRFSITVLDSALAASRSCAVFFIPFGHECEYRFASEVGLQAIAESASCKRLLAVRCNKPHAFPAMAELQAELSPIALSLRPRDMNISSETIPFMALNEENEWEVIFEGETSISGKFIIEEAPVEGDDSAIQRRLIFLQNQNFVQTEIRLVLPKLKKQTKVPSKKGGKSKRTAGASSTAAESSMDVDIESMLQFDCSHLDFHHKALLSAMSLTPEVIVRGTSKTAEENAKILVVGLGGGSITMALQRYLPSAGIIAVDLDDQMEAIASNHFKFRKSANTRVIVDDGMHYIGNLATDSSKNLHDVIFIDVDSKDPSLALSAPPACFISLASLTAMLSLLRTNGMLCLNVVARGGPKLIHELIGTLISAIDTFVASERGCFNIYKIQPSEETVNILIIVVKTKISGASTTGKKVILTETRLRNARENAIESWLQGLGLSSDPLRIVDLIPKIEHMK